MKKLLIILFLFCSFISFAQIQKGTIVIGGNLSFGGSTENNDFFTSDYSSNRGSFNLGGSFEKFVNDQTAIGLGLNYSYNNFEYSGGYDYGRNQHFINVGAGISHYVPIVSKLYFTVDSYLFFGIGGSKEEDSDEKYGIWSTGLNVSPGIVFFLNDKWALNAGIGRLYYTYRSEKAKEENSSGERPQSVSHDYGLNLSANTFSIGLRYYLRTTSSD